MAAVLLALLSLQACDDLLYPICGGVYYTSTVSTHVPWAYARDGDRASFKICPTRPRGWPQESGCVSVGRDLAVAPADAPRQEQFPAFAFVDISTVGLDLSHGPFVVTVEIRSRSGVVVARRHGSVSAYHHAHPDGVSCAPDEVLAMRLDLKTADVIQGVRGPYRGRRSPS